MVARGEKGVILQVNESVIAWPHFAFTFDLFAKNIF